MQKNLTPVILLILIFSFFSGLFAEGLARILLKTGPKIETVIKKVQKWGLEIENGRTISYKVIQQILTTDPDLSDQIKTFIPDLASETTAKGTVIRFEGATMPAITVEKSNYSSFEKSLGFLFFGSSKKLDNFRFSVQLKPEKSRLFFLRAGISQGRYQTNNHYIVETETAVDTSFLNYATFGIDLGAGITLRTNSGDISLALNYSRKSLDVEADTEFGIQEKILEDSQDMISIGAYFQPNLLDKTPVLIMIGPRYYVKDINAFENGGKLAIDIGFGVVF